jgi:SAM-dependent methyltransferase
LELGAGKDAAALPERVCIDLNKQAGPDCQIWHDLEHGIPLPRESVHTIHANQLLEHIWNIILLMNECYRVLIPGGTFWASVPHFQSVHAWGDPTHIRAFTPVSFKYYCREDGMPFAERFSDYGIKADFVLDKIEVREKLDIQVWLKKPLV